MYAVRYRCLLLRNWKKNVQRVIDEWGGFERLVMRIISHLRTDFNRRLEKHGKDGKEDLSSKGLANAETGRDAYISWLIGETISRMNLRLHGLGHGNNRCWCQS
eukprot:GEMP01065120.1.p1 GENE.GEMP01065120.1~~GEMP01065120.1.p1  ORF type:complete len:114 (+),score=12.34 GEMP01065120.1:32-343(+)